MKNPQTPPPVRCPAGNPQQPAFSRFNEPVTNPAPAHLMRRLAVLIMAILCLSPDICRALPYSWNSGTTWVTPGNWFPAGPPLAADDANFFGGGTSFVELNNGGAGHSVNTVDFNAGTPNYYLQDDYNFFTSFTDALNVGLSITKNGLNTVTMASMLINCPTLNINSGAFDMIGTNVATFTTANINGGIVCVTGFYPSVITAGNWNVNSGGTLKGTGINTITPGGYATLIGNVNVAAGGTLLAGCSPGTCNIQGNVVFAAGAQSVFELAVPNVVGGGSDLFNIDGDLTLNGTFDVVAVTGFGAGTYRLINYSGALVNNGVALGNLPVGYAAQLDFSTTNQVNLTVTSTTNCCQTCLPQDVVCVTNTIYPGYNLLVNPFCLGTNNSIGALIPNPQDGLVIARWNESLQDYEYVIGYDSGFSGWIDGNFNPTSPYSITLSPGETFMLVNPGSTYTWVICGCPPQCPPTCLTNTTGFKLVGRLGTGVAYWTNLSSCPPTCGTEVKVWNPLTQDFITYTYGASGWSPPLPPIGIGQSVLVKIGTDVNCGPCTNNLVINGSFESPYIGANTVSQQPGILGWSATDFVGNPTTIELWSGSFNAMAAEDGYQHLEINSLTNNVTVSQVIHNVSMNCPAHFCFWYTGRPGFPDNSFQVEVIGSGVAPASFNPPVYTGPSSWLQYCLDFVPTSTTVTIRFKGTSGSALAGAHIDNVSLMQCCTNLPCTNNVTVNCSTNKTVGCNSSWSFDFPVITEAGGGTNYTVSFTTSTNGPCPYSQYTRNWVITDACGNTNFCSQTVKVTNPAPLLSCATNKTVFCGSAWSFNPPSVLNGSCNTTTTVLNTVTNGICPKDITRMWLVSNPCGFSNFCSQTVSIIDNTPPIVTCPTNKTVICGSAWNFDAPTATDDCSGTNVSITVVSTVTNGICPKVITRLWKLTDQCGNFANCFQQVTVSYASLVLNCTTNKTVPCGSAWTFDAPVLADSSCGTLSILTTYTNGTDCSKAISRIWVATNTCGAYITCTQTVAVVDNIAPSLCCPNDMTFTTCSNSVVANFKVKVTDNCSSGLVASNYPASGSSFPVGTTTVYSTATDACGNVGTCSFKVTVKAGVLKWQTVSLGKLDCFKNGSDYFKNGVDNTPRSPALKSLGAMQGFDGNAISATKFGASFLGLSNAINCATLEIWMRPNSFGSNYPALDTISLGLTNYPAAPKFAWTNFIGNADEPNSILHHDWVSAPNCGTKITLDLANLPNGSGTLLPVINQTHRLDILVKALTEVDYARLCYCYCASKQVWKGLEWDMSNATMYRACDDVIFVKRSGLGALTFGTAVGQTYGIGLGFEPIGFASTVDGLTFKAQRVSGASPNHVTVSGDGAGGLEFRSANVRSNVTHLEVTLYNGNTTVSQSTLAWSPTALIANTDAGAKIVRASVTDAGDRQLFKLAGPVLMGNNSNAPVVADSIAIKFIGAADVPGDLVEGYFFDTEIDAEIALNDATVLTGDLETRVTGEAVTAVSGDVTTITASEMLTNNPVSFTIPVSSQLPPLVINPTFNACRYWITDGLLNGTLVGVGNATFTLVTNVWKVDCSFPPLNPSGIRWQVLSSGTVVADTGVTPVTSASVTSLPNQWRFSNIAAEGVFRLNWADLTLFTINGNDVGGDELRLIPLGGAPIPNLTTFSVTSQGIESLTLTAPSAPAQWIMLPLQLTGNQVNVQWTGPGGGVLESAPTVLGPWATVPDQTDLSTIVPRTTAPAQFFRVRSN